MKKSFIKVIDKYIGFPLCVLLYIVGLFRKKPKEIKKIMVIMFWGIGSNINAMPILRSLKERYGAKITVLIPKKNESLFYKNKYVDEKLFVDLSFFPLLRLLLKYGNKFDMVVDTEHWLNISAIIAFVLGRKRLGFSNRFRSILYTDKIKFDKTKHSVVNNLKLVGNDDFELEKIKISNKDKKFVNYFFKKNKVKGFVVGMGVGSGTTVTQRRWPEENFAKLADMLVEKYNARVILVGSKNEIKLMNKIKSLMKSKAFVSGFDLGKTIYLIEKCGVFIGNDSGPMHIAACQGVKTIGLFGPETPEIFGPYTKKTISFFKKVGCNPCIHIYDGRYDRCKYKDNRCLKAISVEEVFEAVGKLK